MKLSFSYHNKISQAAVRFFSLIWLNLLWFLTSLPLFTIGASTTALYYVTLRMVRGDEGYLTRDYLRAFLDNFKKSTLWFLAASLVSMICITDFIVLGNSISTYLRLFSFLILGFYLLCIFAGIYVLPLMAQFRCGIATAFRSSLTLAYRNFHWTICLTILQFALPLLILYRFLPLIVCGISLSCFLQSLIINRIFRYCLPDETFRTDETAVIPHNSLSTKGY